MVIDKGMDIEMITPMDGSRTSGDEKPPSEEGTIAENTNYPEGYHLLLICIATCLAIFLVALVSPPNPKSPFPTNQPHDLLEVKKKQSTNPLYNIRTTAS